MRFITATLGLIGEIGKQNMSDRQKFVDRVRDLQREVKARLDKGKFVKEVERVQLEEALKNLSSAEEHLNGFLQVDKYRGN